jgi:hydroxymethylglutaryl-CoA lyase
MIKIIECPRDAMQGIKEFIPTEKKINYINSLLKVGFDTIDFGSFVSAKSIPQMHDTAMVLDGLNLTDTKSKLLAIIANVRGAEDAVEFDEISYLGFPFSISEIFQQRNTNSSIEESLIRVEEIQDLCLRNNKSLVVYLSMAFGNPYNEPWNAEIATKWTKKLVQLGIKTIALSDTIGVSNPDNIKILFSSLIHSFPGVEFGAHLHTTSEKWLEKVESAYKSGCRRFDSAIRGFGGCPMAEDKLVGNMPTENLLEYFKEQDLNLRKDAFNESMKMALETFPIH